LIHCDWSSDVCSSDLDVEDNIVVRTFNPGLTSSSVGFSSLLVDAYGSITRGSEIETLGILSQSTQGTNLTNTGSQVTILNGTIVPSFGKTIPANWWTVGKVVSGRVLATLTRSTATGGSIGIGLSFGGNTSAFINISLETTATGFTNNLDIEFMITCRTVGASGQFHVMVKCTEMGLNVISFPLNPNSIFTTNSVNTTTDHTLDVICSASVNVTLRSEQAIIEYKN